MIAASRRRQDKYSSRIEGVAYDARIRTEQLRVLFKTTPLALTATLAGVLLLAATVWFAETRPRWR